MNSELPWLAPALDALAPLTARPPNALIFLDAQRDNAHALARRYLANLLCLAPQNGQSCGQCQSCHLIVRGLHPDYFYHQDKLKIEHIRDLNAQIATTPAISARRAIYLGNIDAYDEPALNALLKTLEEPPSHSHFCLSAPNRAAVKPTILSRARAFPAPAATPDQALQFLLAHHIAREAAVPLLARHHGNPHAALAESTHGTPAPAWQMDSLIALCLAPHQSGDFLLALESVPKEQVLDWVIAQVETLIAACQLDKAPQTWQNPAPPPQGLNLLHLHRLYAALCKNRHPARRQGSPVPAVKALLLEHLDPRNPLL